MKIHPLGDRILIKRVDEEEQVSGGIIIPDTAKEKPQEAEVVAVGPGRRGDDGDLIALDVRPGQHVLIGKYAGNEVEVDGEEYVILSEDDVLGILE
ncbi:MAG: co-chaperone GroES [Gemmatimonadetes bacterium]|nr:co-chaperone GroES [Gemmatimonadota bacterium]|tara:strand:+ start:1756 stop:2043 length:288 start_codon:yes stop_codon:yes gene_type:complete